MYALSRHLVVFGAGLALLATAILAAPAYTNAQESGLTEDQVTSILDLLNSFDASADTVDNVEAALRGEPGDETDEGEGESSPAGGGDVGPDGLPEQASDRAQEVMQCLQLGQSMAPGVAGSQVQQVQKFLKQKGFFDYEEATGYYGPITTEAVQEFQKARGIVDSGSPETTGFGRVGPQTRSALAQATCLSGGDAQPGADAAEDEQGERPDDAGPPSDVGSDAGDDVEEGTGDEDDETATSTDNQ